MVEELFQGPLTAVKQIDKFCWKVAHKIRLLIWNETQHKKLFNIFFSRKYIFAFTIPTMDN